MVTTKKCNFCNPKSLDNSGQCPIFVSSLKTKAKHNEEMARYKDSDRFPTALPRSERQGSCQKECKEFGVWLEMDFDRVLGIAGNLSKLSEVQLNHLHNEINEQTGSLVQAVERHKANGKRIPEVRILDTSIIEDQLAVSIIKKIEECKKVCNPQQK